MRQPYLSLLATPDVRVEFRQDLTAHRGKLLSAQRLGSPVHAGTFLHRNLIVLDSALQRRPTELRRILLHELAHFTWWRLGNPKRLSWERLLAAELEKNVAGELGWSSEWRKQALSPADRKQRTRKWREYCCESFCDSAAWFCAAKRRHPEWTLPASSRKPRRAFFNSFYVGSETCALLAKLEKTSTVVKP
ncbi:MAG: hypothetical protein M3Z85_08530 [Acidobacteriota bacterium]|nr:hypothetical protein [Acidobacteriota bacterium]